MISLHKLNSDPVVVNPELILTVEACPDTVITFVDQRRLIVEESVDEVVEAVMDYRRALASAHAAVQDADLPASAA